MPFAQLAAAAVAAAPQLLQRSNENAAGSGGGKGITGFLNALSTRRLNKEKVRLSALRRGNSQQANQLFLDPLAEGGPFEGLDQGFQDILGELEGFGEGRRASIEQGALESKRSSQAQLQGRGLGSSVLLANVERGSERQRQLLLGNLDDDVTQLRVGARSNNQQRLLAQQQLLANLIQV